VIKKHTPDLSPTTPHTGLNKQQKQGLGEEVMGAGLKKEGKKEGGGSIPTQTLNRRTNYTNHQREKGAKEQQDYKLKNLEKSLG